MTIKEIARSMKSASPKMAATSGDDRNRALKAVKDALIKNKDEIFKANAADLENAKEAIESIRTFKDLWEHFELEENYMKAEEDGSKFFIEQEIKRGILKKYKI